MFIRIDEKAENDSIIIHSATPGMSRKAAPHNYEFF